MREIGLLDVFAWSEIIDKLDIIDKIGEIQEKSMTKQDPQTYLGVQLMSLLISKLYVVKDEVVSWLASFTGKDIKEVEQFSIMTIKEYIQEFMNNPEFVDLFSSLVSKEEI